MTKSYADVLEGLYLAILRDCERNYPQFAAEWKRDQTRLLLALRQRGTRFFTVELPAMGKHFDKCLSLGSLTASGLPFQGTEYNDESVIPRLFRVLLKRVFSENGELRSDVDTTAIFLLRSLYYGAKKLRQECPSDAVRQTVKEFFDIEAVNRHPTLEWDGDDIVVDGAGSRVSFADAQQTPSTTECEQLSLFIEEEQHRPRASACLPLLQRVSDWIVGSQFGPIDWAHLRPKHGPGAVSDARVGIDSKYSFPHWPAKLERTFPIQEFGYANLRMWEHDHSNRGSLIEATRLHEPPSRLIAVPKTQKGPRLIASEPTCHQWMQQALKRELERMVSRSFLRNSISFASQVPSRIDALESSRTGERATIDLSSASDRLTCWTVERVFRTHGDLLHAFHAVRTRWLINEIDKRQPKYTKLRKFAAQGSALTFPVQSIVYAIVAIAGVIHSKQWELSTRSLDRASRLVRVYGDDIIVPVDSCGVVTELLAELGLKVNPSKTFSEGLFRESCGMDAYAGVDVTPAYVLEVCDKTRPESVVSVVQSSNNFYEKRLWEAASYLRSTVPKELRKYIPEVAAGSGAFGFSTFGYPDNSHLKVRVNKNYQRLEYRRLMILSKVKKRTIEGIESLLQWYTENPGPDILWTSGTSSRAKLSLRLSWDSAVR